MKKKDRETEENRKRESETIGNQSMEIYSVSHK